MRLLIAAGGTGGHIYPGLAVASEFLARHPDADVRFVGTPRGLEEEIVQRAGFRVEMLRVEPLRGGSLFRKLRGLVALVPALFDAYRLLRRTRPDAVVGVGGYLSGPLLLVASKLRTPTLILEPNVELGLANRWLKGSVDAAAVAWQETATHFGNKAFVAGNPIRAEIAEVSGVDAARGIAVLLFGGSQGSVPLNDAMIAALPRLAGSAISVVHQTGPDDLERVRAAYGAYELDARIEPYLERMHDEYARSTLVVSRSGATTCAELAAAGRGAVLVPLELAGGHQRHNAEALARAGAAVIIPQAELSGERLAETLLELADNPERLTRMGTCARQLAKPDAAAKIVDRLEALIH